MTFCDATPISMVDPAMTVLLFMTMPLESPVPDFKALFAAGFHLEGYWISHSFMDSIVANGNPGPCGRDVGYWMRMMTHL